MQKYNRMRREVKGKKGGEDNFIYDVTLLSQARFAVDVDGLIGIFEVQGPHLNFKPSSDL